MEIWMSGLKNRTGRDSFGFGLYIHPENVLSHLREGNARYIRFKFGAENFFQITYDYIESNYLPHPYESNCVNYSSTRFESLGDCVERCYEANYKMKHDAHFGVISTINYTEVNVGNAAEIKYDHEIDSNCCAKCRIGCETINYVSIINSQFIIHEMINVFALSIASMRQYVYVTSTAGFGACSFVIYLASIISLWLGFSVYGSPIDVINYFN